MNKKVVSLALFDPPAAQKRDMSYTEYLPAVIRGNLSAYHGWELWIYHDSSLYHCDYGDTLVRLHNAGKIRLIYAGECERLCESMLWRMMPMFDPDVEWFATRDVDAVPQPRDWRTIDAFSHTDKTVQVIHDSESHSGFMGGMACYNAPRLRAKLGYTSWDAFRDRAREFGVNNYGSDQKFLAREIKEADEIVRFPPRSDPRDHVAPHIGGAGPAQPVIAWYDAQHDVGAATARYYEAMLPVADCYRYAVLGMDDATAYASFAPITALLWRAVAGYGSVLICVGKPEDWQRSDRLRATVNAAREVGAKVYWIDPRGRRTSCVAQVARLYAGALTLHPNPYLLTSDLDMWPIDRAYFWQQPMEKPWHQFFANAAGGKFYPICYIGAKRTKWREIMGIDADLETVVHRALQGVKDDDSDGCWTFDERHYSERIKAIPGYRDWWWGLDRDTGHMRRIDRSRWPAQPDAKGMIDAHCIRPAHERWGELRPLFGQLSPTWVEWADKFIVEYKEAQK